MRFIFLMGFLGLLINCQNLCSNDFYTLLSSPEWQTIMEFKNPKSVYRPSYDSFIGFCWAKQTHRVDLLFRSDFTPYLHTVFHNNHVQYDQLLLLESYSSGERITREKIILLKCGSDVQSFSFERVSGTWALVNKPLVYSEKISPIG